MKIGDKVRFLSETGGGTIAGFKDKNIVLVEDEFGFQIPTPSTDIVVINTDDYDIGKVVKKRIESSSSQKQTPSSTQETEPIAKISHSTSVVIEHNVEERKGGDKLSCYLAFVPIDIKEVTSTNFECYFVNDSNYYVHYSYLVAEGTSWTLRSSGEIEPNTKEFIEEFGREALNSLSHVAIQLIAYKRDKPFIMKPAIDVQFRIDSVKFYKLHTFRENDFFEQPALIYTIIENDKMPQILTIDAKTLKEEMYHKDDTLAMDTKRQHSSKSHEDNTLVVDLHAHELLDSIAGMSNADILTYQIEKFREIMDENSGMKGKKIIFIHGKGDGILRNAIIQALNRYYKKYTYHDASFQEYGYGATQVTIQ